VDSNPQPFGNPSVILLNYTEMLSFPLMVEKGIKSAIMTMARSSRGNSVLSEGASNNCPGLIKGGQHLKISDSNLCKQEAHGQHRLLESQWSIIIIFFDKHVSYSLLWPQRVSEVNDFL
jgi:hypothetical protein